VDRLPFFLRLLLLPETCPPVQVRPLASSGCSSFAFLSQAITFRYSFTRRRAVSGAAFFFPGESDALSSHFLRFPLNLPSDFWTLMFLLPGARFFLSSMVRFIFSPFGRVAPSKAGIFPLPSVLLFVPSFPRNHRVSPLRNLSFPYLGPPSADYRTNLFL